MWSDLWSDLNAANPVRLLHVIYRPCTSYVLTYTHMDGTWQLAFSRRQHYRYRVRLMSASFRARCQTNSAPDVLGSQFCPCLPPRLGRK